MIAFIDRHKDRFGVEPICRVLPIAPSTSHNAHRRPATARAVRDSKLKAEIARIHAEHFGVYGARKLWRQLHREGITVAGCTVERLMVSWTWRASAVARPAGPPWRIRPRFDPRIWWSGTSRRPGRTSCGSRIAPLWPAGPALSRWPWSSTRSPGSWWAGRPRGRCALTWPWMPWRWPSGAGRPSWMAWCITRTGAANICPSANRAAGRGRRGHLSRLPRRQLRQCPGRDDHWAVQDRADSPPRAVEGPRPGRVRHAGVGRLVQPPPALRAHWLCAACRVRGRILARGGPQRPCSTQATKPPMNPGRFTL
jgi:hypothetical protein